MLIRYPKWILHALSLSLSCFFQWYLIETVKYSIPRTGKPFPISTLLRADRSCFPPSLLALLFFFYFSFPCLSSFFQNKLVVVIPFNIFRHLHSARAKISDIIFRCILFLIRIMKYLAGVIHLIINICRN